MKVIHVEAMVLKAPVRGIESWRAASFAAPFKHAETTLVRVMTDERITGIGEIHTPVAPEVGKAIVDTLLGPALIGKDPLDVAVRWDEPLTGTVAKPYVVRTYVRTYAMDAIPSNVRLKGARSANE